MTIEQHAAQNLINQAMQAEKSSKAYLLIESAARIDASLDVEGCKLAWLDKWMNQEHAKRNNLQ